MIRTDRDPRVDPSTPVAVVSVDPSMPVAVKTAGRPAADRRKDNAYARSGPA
ncbi:hypothetical protein [Halohasta salina]|uniref:hypothetical protein n=1 Tax=Halohasta salina TaxID=2961621 RepID=UPI0020A5626D|nr:hypothetical protein [Halohasta salina]